MKTYEYETIAFYTVYTTNSGKGTKRFSLIYQSSIDKNVL